MSHLDTQTRYPRRVARPKWTPPDDGVAERIARTVALHKQLREVEEAYRRSLAENADPDGDAVPVAHLADQLGMERKTVYRHLGRSMT